MKQNKKDTVTWTLRCCGFKMFHKKEKLSIVSVEKVLPSLQICRQNIWNEALCGAEFVKFVFGHSAGQLRAVRASPTTRHPCASLQGNAPSARHVVTGKGYRNTHYQKSFVRLVVQ